MPEALDNERGMGRKAGVAPMSPTDELLLSHQACDTLAARVNALGSQLGVNPRAAIDTAPALVGLPNVRRKNLIFLTTLRLGALAPGVVA